jgi:transcriptional regulator with XRE-family HTH domain
MIEPFKQMLSHYKVTGKQLSERTGIAQATISDIRRRESDPSASTLWRLVIAADEIAPGALRYFCSQLASSDLLGDKLEQLIDLAEDSEIERVMLAIAKRWRTKSEIDSKEAVGASR